MGWVGCGPFLGGLFENLREIDVLMEKCTELWGLEEFGEMGNKGKMALLLGKGCRAGHSTCTFRYFSYIVLDHWYK